MKCKQKLCQRTRNICSSGNCNVCDDAIDEITKKFEAKKKKSNFDKVQFDMKLMVDTHRKLANGTKVESKVVNELLIGGVLNILSQSEAFEDLEAQVKALTNEDRSNKARIESLENWVMKQDDAIKKLDEKLFRLDENGVLVKESNEIETIRKKLVSVEIDISSMKMRTGGGIKVFDGNEIKENVDVENLKQTVINLEARMLGGEKLSTDKIVRKNSKSCNICDKILEQNCDYEKHMEEHQIEKKYKCDKCGKMFHLEWRLRKHITIHDENGKYCHYFNNRKQCPFEEIGCKFLHIRSERCKFENCKNNLCQFSHDGEIDNVSDDEENDESIDLEVNQCHLCRAQLPSKAALIHHVETNHEEYYQGVLEAAANLSSSDI